MKLHELLGSDWSRRKRVETRKQRLGRYRNWRNGIIMIDGEGKTDTSRRHHYTLLANSKGSYIESDNLSTLNCLEFLLSLPVNQLIVTYSFNYDVTMWLKDIPMFRLKLLHKRGYIRWRNFHITYIPSREFIVRQDSRSCHIYDIFPFFQCSFARALEDWKIGNAEQQQHILTMKAERSNFDALSDVDIKRYCLLECQLGVELTLSLIECLVSEDLEVSRWYGPGPIAQKLLDNNHIKDSLKLPDDPAFIDAVMRAYFGGRTEIAGAGHVGFHKPDVAVHSYDINSAYPYACLSLPCLACSIWAPTTIYKGEGLYHVAWKLREQSQSLTMRWPDYWPPFPVRKNHRISYPLNGEGWYWHHEVIAALEVYGPRVQVIAGYRLIRNCDHQPFAFLEALYQKRLVYKKQGDRRHMTLRLGYNSIYGKLAQTVGYRSRNGQRRPRYQNFILAGLITSHCRAQVFRAVQLDPGAIRFIATDGILSIRELPLPVSLNLGEWDHAIYHNAFIVQPGIYCTDENRRIRGFWNRSIDFQDLEATFRDNVIGTYHYKSISFIGIATASLSTDLEPELGNWVEMARRITFCPQTRLLQPAALLALGKSSFTWVDHLPPYDRDASMSEPYKPYSSAEEKCDNGMSPLTDSYLDQP